MKFGLSRIWRNLIVAALCPMLLFCAGCPMMTARLPLLGNPLPVMRSAILDPFGGVDHRQVTQANADATLVNNRKMLVTAVAGKQGLTLQECRSIALANSLDLQAARMEELTREHVAFSNKTKLLPHFVFSGDLSQRDNPSYAYSEVLGQEGLPPKRFPTDPNNPGVTSFSTSHERGTWRYVLETRWSPTDAALAYYLSKSSINDRLKAHYTKVRVGQKLVAAVDGAYYRLLSLQGCLPLAEQLCASRSSVAGKMRQAFEKKLVTVEEYNRARQNCTKAGRLLSRIRNEMEKQRNILASTMALSPDYCVDGGFWLIGVIAPPSFDQAVCDMELIAVRNRPEAQEAGLSHINSSNDLKRAVIRYFPKVSGFWRWTRDKDKFLYNKDWKEVGMSVYFDLLDLATSMVEKKAAESNLLKTQREMGTVALGVTSQVRIAALQYADSLDELQATEATLRGTSEVLQVAEKRAAREDLDRLALEDVRASLLQNRIERTRALGESNATLAELQAAMGTNYGEPTPAP